MIFGTIKEFHFREISSILLGYRLHQSFDAHTESERLGDRC